MLHVFIGEILASMTQVSDVAPGPLVFFLNVSLTVIFATKPYLNSVSHPPQYTV
jgi:hypothetical protein